jgi:hypothetical protein
MSEPKKSLSEKSPAGNPPPEKPPSVKGGIGDINLITGFITGLLAVVAALAIPTNLIMIAIMGGLFITGLMIRGKQLSIGTAILAWLIAAILMAVASALIPSMKTIVTGNVINSNGKIVDSLPLRLADSSGVDHKNTTDSTGVFSINDVPRGKYMILIDDRPVYVGNLSTLWIAQLFERTVDVGALVYNPPPPTVTSTPTITSTQFICPYQGQTDEETIVNLIQAEAVAVNTEDLDIINAIFVPNADFYDYATVPPDHWNGTYARYAANLFPKTEFQGVEHFDILSAGPGISGNTAFYTSGSKGSYRIGAGPLLSLDNGSAKSTQYGSEHWILEKNTNGCWMIIEMQFNAGDERFP